MQCTIKCMHKCTLLAHTILCVYPTFLLSWVSSTRKRTFSLQNPRVSGGTGEKNLEHQGQCSGSQEQRQALGPRTQQRLRQAQHRDGELHKSDWWWAITEASLNIGRNYITLDRQSHYSGYWLQRCLNKWCVTYLRDWVVLPPESYRNSGSQ